MNQLTECHFLLAARRCLLQMVVIWTLGALMLPNVVAQAPATTVQKGSGKTAPEAEELSRAPAKVDVRPVAKDQEIRLRIQRVLNATGWFIEPNVRVEQGVVFLSGHTQTSDLKNWASELAGNTQDVVAVANGIEVVNRSIWDFAPAWSGLTDLWRDAVRSLPFFIFALLILGLSAGAGLGATRITKALLRSRVRANLLRNVVARAIGILAFLAGTYIVLRVSGLTQLALTVVGGTGLIGLVVGIAFRDISENFLASIFLSLQRPFETGDLVEVAGVTGYVQQLNVRVTILMTLDGNVVQIPNATVYKSNLRNFSTNPNRREDFVVGIGYDDSINEAQEVAQKVLQDHPAVLADPEPSVLAESLASSTVNLRIYFWLDGREHSWLKVRSSVIRLVKRAFQAQGISMPDDAREIVFPRGIPVTMLQRKPDEEPAAASSERSMPSSTRHSTDLIATDAEAGLSSEASVIQEQAQKVPPLKEGENLLRHPASST